MGLFNKKIKAAAETAVEQRAEKPAKKNQYIEYIADKHNIPYKEAKEMMQKAKEDFAEYGVSYRGYVLAGMDEMSHEEQLAAAKDAFDKREQKKEKAIENLMEETGKSREETMTLLDEVKEKFGIGPIVYYGRKYFAMSEGEIAADINARKAGKEPADIQTMLAKAAAAQAGGKKKTSVKKNRYVEYIAEKHSISYDEAKAVMDKTKEDFADYGVTYRGYVVARMDEKKTVEEQRKAAADAQRKREQKKANAIRNIMDVTGMSAEEVDARLAEVKEKFNIGPRIYYGRLYYNMTDEEIQADLDARKEKNEMYVNLCAERSGRTPEDIRKHMFHVECKYSIDNHDYMLFRAYECTDEQLDGYLSIKHSRRMPAKYNQKGAGEVTSDKILFNKVFGDFTNRKYWVNEDTSYEEFCKFIEGLEYIFLKPVNLCQGKGTRKIVLAEVPDKKVLYDELMAEPKMLVEEGVIQHPVMKAVHPNSINTVRIFSLQQGDEVRTLAAFVRFGMNGSIVDNMVAGGSIGGVDEKTGIIETPIVDRDGNAFEVHPNSGIQIKGMQIPMWDEIIEMTEKGVRHAEGLNYIGWDVALTEKGPVIIEANTMPGLASYQVGYAQSGEGRKFKFDEYL